MTILAACYSLHEVLAACYSLHEDCYSLHGRGTVPVLLNLKDAHGCEPQTKPQTRYIFTSSLCLSVSVSLTLSRSLSRSLSLATSSRSRPSRATRSAPVSWSTSRTWGPGSAGCWWTGWSWCRSSSNCCRRRCSSPWTPSTDTSRLHHSHPGYTTATLKFLPSP